MSGGKSGGKVLPCANPVLSAPLAAAHHDLRNESISGTMKLVSSVFQAGMALYKIVPKNPYYFWSVMSLIMQVRALLGLAVAAALLQKCSEGKRDNFG